jgi:uncharacterized phage protein gp47/JayE
MAYGVSPDGFELKGFDAILEESRARARAVFDSPDLSPTSALGKILQVTAAEDAELWKRMEALYYANFISTAFGASLDRLGEDLGVARNPSFARAVVRFTLAEGEPDRDYAVPAGTVITTNDGAVAFHTLEECTLSAAAPQADVESQAFERGRVELAAGALSRIDAEAGVGALSLGGAKLRVTNPAPVADGEALEDDEAYRARLLARPRTMWTLESVRREVMDVPGVIDVLATDDLGGVDVSQGYFKLFAFGQRAFSADRRLGEPYFFDVIVAHEPSRRWDTTGNVSGVYERVRAAVDRVRPAGIHANIVQADHIEIGVRARVVAEAGHDRPALVAAIKERLARDIGALRRLGGAVLFSQTLRAFVEQAGVVDVQDLHLRRRPAAFGRFSFGGAAFQTQAIESPVGANVAMGRTEIAVFRVDSDLIEIEAAPR